MPEKKEDKKTRSPEKKGRYEPHIRSYRSMLEKKEKKDDED